MRRSSVWGGLALAVVAAVAGGCAPSLSDARSPSGDAGPRDAAEALAEVGGEVDGGGVSDAPVGLTGADLVGNWSGTSSLDLPVSFSVDAPGLVAWEIGWRLPDCGSAVVATFPPVAIVDGQVTKSIPVGKGGVSMALTVAFTSTTAATGTLDFTLMRAVAGGCDGHGAATFTATRDP